MLLKHFALVAVAAGFASAGIVAPASAEKVKFDFWYGNTGEIARVVQNMCDDFNKSQDKYAVQCTSQGSYDATLQNTIAAFRAQKQPTLVQIYDIGTATMMLSDAYVPATKLMADAGYKIDWKDFFPGIARYYATSKGELLSFPFNSSTAVMYWNKDLLGKIGKTEAPKTIEEMGKDMAALKQAGVSCPFAMDISTNESWQLMEEVSAMHNQPISTLNNGYDGLGAKLEVNKTLFVKYATDLKKWYDDGLLVLKSPKAGQGYVQAFAAGDCAFTLSSIGDDGTIASTQKKGMNWGVAMMPVYAGIERKNTLVGGASIWTLKGHSKEEYAGAAAFLNWLHEPKQALFWSTHTGYIPVTNSGYQYMKAHGFYDKQPYKDRAVAIESLTASEPTDVTRGIRLGNFTAIRKDFSDEMQAIFTNATTVQAGLDTLVKRGNESLDRFAKTYPGKTLP